MLRACVPILFASALATAAPVPELPKAVKERKALLADLGIPDTGQKVLPIPKGYESDNVTDANVAAEPKKYALRAACRKAAEILLAHRSKPLPQTFSFAGGFKKVKEAMREVQVSVATRTLDLDEAADALHELTDRQLKAETSTRWRATHRFLVAAVEQEIAALQEYNLALGRVITEAVDAPAAADGFNALKLEPAAKMMSQRRIREQSEDAAKEFGRVAKEHPDTPWAAFAEVARDRTLGLHWVPTKMEPPKPKKK